MSNKVFKTRIIQKHKKESEWRQTDFIPFNGEFIIYDEDENNAAKRIKIGDGITDVNNLPFLQTNATATSEAIEEMVIDTICSAVIYSAEEIKL